MSNSLGMITVKTFLTQGDMWWVAGDLKEPKIDRSENRPRNWVSFVRKRTKILPEMDVENADGDDNRDRHQDHGEE